jgi:predicted TIM-barrel fold metal-dependent hydrolase
MEINDKHKRYYDWLAQVKEEIINPELPIIDPHHHLWNGDNQLAGSFPYLIENLSEDTNSGHNIVGTIFMECSQGYYSDGEEKYKPVGETEFVINLIKDSEKLSKSTNIIGIIGFADLMLGHEVKDVLNTHLSKGEGLFRGTRHAAGWDKNKEIHNSHSNPIENIYHNKSFMKGAEELINLSLTFDAWHYHHQINDLSIFAKKYPELTIIHDHFGGPLGVGPYEGKKEEIFKKWKDDISLLSESKNVYAKLGGLAMPVNGWNFHKQNKPASSDQIVDMHHEYYLHTINCFGVERCMFESNFPVDRRSVSYHVIWNAFKKMVLGYSNEDKKKLFFKNAKDVYGV